MFIAVGSAYDRGRRVARAGNGEPVIEALATHAGRVGVQDLPRGHGRRAGTINYKGGEIQPGRTDATIFDNPSQSSLRF